VLIGVGDLETREVTLANAGHLPPLIIAGGAAEYFPTDVGVPLGVTPSTYATRTVCMPPGSTLLCFTDGLVERRGESIDVGLQRLAAAASPPRSSADALLTHILADLNSSGSEDDVALLAFRWLGPDAPEAAESAAG
jgi:serine phosphatase RsbU (regulator of sigma subunit)